MAHGGRSPPSRNEAGPDRRIAFGRVEELAVFQRNVDAFISGASRAVPCRYCNMYIGTPEAIRSHEESHTANGELRVLPDSSELYARVTRSMQEAEEDQRRLEIEERRNEAWRNRLWQILRRKHIELSEELLARMRISVRSAGEPLEVGEFERLLENASQSR